MTTQALHRTSSVSPEEGRFAEIFGPPRSSLRVALAPGRINLIGEHTDYNDGWVLPMAIDRSVRVAFVPRTDRTLRVHSEAHGRTHRFDLDDLPANGGGAPWWGYVVAVASSLAGSGADLRGIDALVGGDLPMARGLSSSAALTVAMARAFCGAADIPWRPREMALTCAKAERDGVGVACGVMDPMASALGQPGRALLVDCRSLEVTPVPLPAEVALVVLDTGVARTLATSAFHDRQRSCGEAVAALRRLDPSIQALRDATDEKLDEVARNLEDRTVRHARHVIAECRRPRELAQALANGDLRRAGELLDQSHASLRDLYEVSCPELDEMTARARRHPACFGARLTGAGFGGCAIALVDAARVEEFILESSSEERVSRTDSSSERIFRVEASAGARLLESGESGGAC